MATKHELDAIRKLLQLMAEDSDILYTKHGRRGLMQLTGLSKRSSTVLARHLKKEINLLDMVNSYTFDAEEEEYRFIWKDRLGSVRAKTFTVDAFRQIVSDYTHSSVGGANKTMQEVAIKHDLTRDDFDNIRRIYELTKKHEPLTVEDMAVDPEDKSVRRLVAEKRRRIDERASAESYRQTQEEARKWREFQKGEIKPWEDAVSRFAVKGYVDSLTPGGYVLKPTGAEESYFLFQVSDLHFGLDVTGVYDTTEAKRRYDVSVAKLIAELHKSDGKKDVVFVIGGDMLHADNKQGKTTSTHHQMEMDGTPMEWPAKITDMVVASVGRILATDKVSHFHLFTTPGNHDSLTSRWLHQAVRLAFSWEPNFTAYPCEEEYMYFARGDTAVVMHHGHGSRTRDRLGGVLTEWIRQNRLPTPFHQYALTGNLHTLKIEAGGKNNLTLLQQPSPAPSDSWSKEKGYACDCSVVFFEIHDTDGLVAMHRVNF